MATGDLNGNLERLLSQMRSIGYPRAINVEGLKMGLPAALLPLLHHALLSYSRHVAKHLSCNGYELHCKSDLRFVEGMMKVIQTEFSYRSPLTVAQIFSKGFAERKMMLVHDVVQCCKRMHNELLKFSRQVVAPMKKTASKRAERGHEASNSLSKKYEVTNYVRNRDLLRSPNTKHPVHVDVVDVKPKSPGGESKKDRSRFVEILMRSPSPVPEKPESPSRLPRPSIDSSLPRRFESTQRTTTDAFLPKVLDSKPLKSCDCAPEKSEPKKLECVPEILPKNTSPRSDQTSSKMLDAITGLLHDEIKQKIHEISEKIEPRFGSFERALSKTSRTMEAQLNGLESRIKLLEEVFRSNASRDVENNSPRKRERHNHGSPRKHNFGWIPSPSHVARDISNVHQDSHSPIPDSFFPDSLLDHRRELSTPELIAMVKARCNKTNELLGRRLI